MLINYVALLALIYAGIVSLCMKPFDKYAFLVRIFHQLLV